MLREWCVSSKFLHYKIRLNYSLLRRVWLACNIESLNRDLTLKLKNLPHIPIAKRNLLLVVKHRNSLSHFPFIPHRPPHDSPSCLAQASQQLHTSFTKPPGKLTEQKYYVNAWGMLKIQDNWYALQICN